MQSFFVHVRNHPLYRRYHPSPLLVRRPKKVGDCLICSSWNGLLRKEKNHYSTEHNAQSSILIFETIQKDATMDGTVGCWRGSAELSHFKSYPTSSHLYTVIKESYIQTTKNLDNPFYPGQIIATIILQITSELNKKNENINQSNEGYYVVLRKDGWNRVWKHSSCTWGIVKWENATTCCTLPQYMHDSNISHAASNSQLVWQEITGEVSFFTMEAWPILVILPDYEYGILSYISSALLEINRQLNLICMTNHISIMIS